MSNWPNIWQTRRPDPVTSKAITLTRFVNAPPELVFAVWTQAEHLKHWFGPACFTTPEAEVDLRVGGRFRIVMRGPDGQDYPCGGEYREIVPGRKLVFTNNAFALDGTQLLEGLTSVTFEAEKDGTRVTVETRATGLQPGTDAMLNGMDQGWNETLDKMAAHTNGV